MADDDPVEVGECNRRMALVWVAIDGHNGMPGMRQQIGEVRDWQIKKDASDEARATAIKSALDDHNSATERRDRRRNFILGAIGLLLAILQWVKH